MEVLEQLFGTSQPVALVTGSGAPRVGQAIARTLAARGYRLVVHAHHSLDDARKVVADFHDLGCEAIAVGADLSKETEVRSMFDATMARFGRIDVLVNSAAIWQRRALEQVTADDVRRHFEANTLGTYLCCQTFGLQMTKQPMGGAIVNLGDWAIVRPYRDFSAYFPSKGSIPALTRDFAVELATRNPRVRVNAILPGPVMLPADLSAEERAVSIQGTLVKREGSAQNVADAAVALIENDFITGVCLPVDGGRSIGPGLA